MKRWFLKVQSCKLYDNKYMITSTQITNTEIFTFIAVLVFKLLSHKCTLPQEKLEISKIGVGQMPAAPVSELKFSFTCFLKFLKHFHVAKPFYRRFVNDEPRHIFLVLMES